MRKMVRNMVRNMVSAALCAALALTALPAVSVRAEETTKTRSQIYAEAMGSGINLGNTFDAFDRVNHSEIDDETAWGNPTVTQAYMNESKRV